MKKIFALICVFFIFGFCCNLFVADFSKYSGEVTFVTTKKDDLPFATKVVACGDKQFVTCNLENFDVVEKKLDTYESFSLRAENLDVQSFVKQYKVKFIKQENIDQKTVIYGYSRCFNKHIIVDNKFSNVQIVASNDMIQVVGVPAVLDSF